MIAKKKVAKKKVASKKAAPKKKTGMKKGAKLRKVRAYKSRDGLTPAGETLLAAMLLESSIKKAAESCGLSYDYCRQLAAKPVFIDRLLQARTKVARQARTDAAWVLREQRKVYERCMQVEPILDKDGNMTGEFKFDASNANKALENIGKHVSVQAFKDRLEIDPSKGMMEFFAALRQTKGPPRERK